MFSIYQTIYPIKIKDHDLKILNLYLDFTKETIRFCNELKKYIGEELFENIFPKKDFPNGINSEDWGGNGRFIKTTSVSNDKYVKPKGISYFFKKVSRTDVISEIIRFCERLATTYI